MKRGFVSIRTKLILLFCVLITVPFMVSGILAYQRYTENVEKDAVNYSQQIANQLAINLDRYIKDIDRITLGLFYDSAVLATLRAHDGPPSPVSYLTTEERSAMSQYMSSLVIDQTEIEGIFIFANDGSLFSNLEETVRARWSAEEEPWMEQAREKEGALAIIPPSRMNYYLSEPGYILSMARQILDPITFQGIGYIKVDLSKRGMESILSMVHLGNQGEIFILNQEGQALYPFELSAGGPDAAAPGSGADGPADGRFLAARSVSDYAGLEVRVLIPREELTRGPREIIRFTAFISVVSLIAAYLSAIYTSGRLVRPIRYLQTKMGVVESGNLDVSAQVHTNDEIGQLAMSFNLMVQRLNRSVKEVYELRIKESEAQLAALQSQMNPHFLYNTLESIRMHALKEDNDRLSAVIASLGELLRYTIDKHERQVTLGSEVEFLEHYLEVQSFRLEDKLQPEIRIDFSHESCLVPKLILQPLVENAIEHGLGDRPLRIVVSSRMDGEHLIVTVEDDGRGMSREKMQSVEAGLAAGETNPAAKRGVGLRNIHQRLKLLYGESAGLFFEKNRALGTSVSLKIPLQCEGEEA